MKASWKKAGAPQEIIRHLNQMYFFEDGKVKIKTIFVDQYWYALESFTEFSKQIPESARVHIVQRAINDAAKTGNISEKGLLEAIGQQEGDYLRRKPSRFHLYTTLTISGEIPTKSIDVGESRIYLQGNTAKYKCTERREKIQYSLPFKDDDKSRKAMFVSSIGRDASDAAAISLDNLNTLRGIWNFLLHDSNQTRRTYSNGAPINSVRLGPVHTSHLPSGSTCEGGHFYEPNWYSGGANLNLTIEKAQFLKEQTEYVLGRMNSSPFKPKLYEAMRRFATSMDNWNYEYAIKDGWSLLELLTSTNGNYNVTVRRTAKAWKEYLLVKETLEFIRSRRNESVHLGVNFGGGAESMAFLVRGYVHALLKLLVWRDFSFQSLEEFGSFLDLTKDPDRIGRQIELLELARK